MNYSIFVLQISVARAIWVAIIAFSTTPYQVVADWHMNCFTPAASKPLSVSIFPDASELSRVGHGAIKRVTPRQTTSLQATSTISVFAQKTGNLNENNLYFQDPQTSCLTKIDLDHPVLSRRSFSFELVHESKSECRERSILGRVNLVEINPCRRNQCERADNDLVLFLGPEEVDGVTFSDVLFYGGEFDIVSSQKPWRNSRKALAVIKKQQTDRAWE